MNLVKTIFGYYLTLLLCNCYAYAQTPDLKFDHLTVEDGLSSNTVYSFLQDSRGFMWFGTSEGLNRYDGYSFKLYRHDPNDSTSISDNFIWFESLYEDRDGMIWVGTKTAGLNRFDPITETFKRFQHDPNDPSSLSSNNSITLWGENSGVLWVGTDRGVNMLNLETETFEHFQHDPDDPASLVHNRIWRIYGSGRENEAELWIGTLNGLDRFDRETRTFEHIRLDGLYPDGTSPQPITDIYSDGRGTLWLGSFVGLVKLDLKTMATNFYRHDPENSNSLNFDLITSIWQDPGTQGRVLWITTRLGLNRFDTETETFSHYAYDPAKPEGISAYSVVGLYEDKFQRLWIGSHSHGINGLNPPMQNFSVIKYDLDNPKGLGSWEVRGIHEDQEGALWIGTQFGLNKWNRTTGIFTRYTFSSETTGIAGANVITGIAEDNHGNLWLGTRGGGLIKFDPPTGDFRQFRHKPANPNSLASDWIGRVYFDSFGTLWVGTSGQIFSRLFPEDQSVGLFTHFNPQPDYKGELTSEIGFAFLEDSYGDFWIGSHFTGLYRLDREAEKFTPFQYAANEPNSISSNIINGMFETRSETDTIMWVATNNGLNRFNRRTKTFTRIYNKHPGGSDFIYSITGDTHHNLWMQNQKGISKFDTEHRMFINYAGSRGLPADMSNGFGYCRNRKGEIFFGGMGGLIYFHPDSIVSNQNIPPIVLTDLKILNERLVLDSSITVKKRLDLTHDQNFFSFDFAALDYTDPKKNQYAYILEGLDQEWIYSGNRHFANYTAVPPGKYIFRVKGSNNDGIWNEEGASLIIKISPPLWRTGWAYTLYVFLIGLTLYGLRRFELRRKELKNELERKDFEAQKLQEVDRLKSRFFANISHEFRTPLTLILGPLQKFLSVTRDTESHQDILGMQRNARRLQQLIDQLLDLSKIEAGRMPLQARPDDILQRIREWTASFVSLAESRDITLDLNFPEQPIIVYFDPEKLEKIIYNLLGNAFKFTPEDGKITVAADIPSSSGAVKGSMAQVIQITISDSGVGIAPEHLDHIFDRFYSANESTTGEQSSTGIGLALTKEFVDLHHGKIEVSSEVGKGSKFTVMLPLGKDHLRAEEIVDIPLNPPSKGDFAVPPFEEPVPIGREGPGGMLETQAKQSSPHQAPTLLIVEDNPDMRRFLRNCLDRDFDIIEAENGKSGYEAAREKMPDLIVSDVMMPEMDGFEFCQKIKTDELTSHIPVILLTARASKESKIEGLETGADDYVVKPFDAEELIARSRNLIQQRQKLRERFSREITVKPKDITVTSIDEQFLQRAINIVEENISNGDFNIDQFCSEIGMSRPTLNRKLRALTGFSTNEFIRTLRLKRASQLLEKRSATIVEIAYEVGFNNPSYFAECFRDQFGKLPSEYGGKE